VVVAGLSAWFAYTSHNEAKRSADSAEKSTEESRKARKMARSDLLAPHFRHVEHFMNALSGDEPTNGLKLDNVEPSCNFLQSALQSDNKMQRVLESLKETINSAEVKIVIKKYRKETERVSLKEQAPDNLDEMRALFGQLKNNYMSIE
jgi:hypothetical protein